MTTRQEASPRRARARRGEGEKLREQILEAASRLLAETGDEEAVSIRAVADAVGVTPPSIYLHFADKTELIFAICEQLLRRAGPHERGGGRRFRRRHRVLILRGRAYISFGLENPEPYRVLFMRKPTDTPLPWQYEKIVTSSAFGHLVQAVTAAIASGRLEGDPMLVSISLWASVHGITSLLISKPGFPWPEIDAMIDEVLHRALFGAVPRR